MLPVVHLQAPCIKSATTWRTPEGLSHIVQVGLIFVEPAIKTGPHQDGTDAEPIDLQADHDTATSSTDKGPSLKKKEPKIAWLHMIDSCTR